jgi:aminopeptidase YwaD
MKAKFISRVSFSIFLITALSLALPAQQVSRNTPDQERLRQHVTYLASAALEGRRTGTPGADKAAQYIVSEFARLGLRSATQTVSASKNKDGALAGFLHQFPYVAGVELGTKNLFTFSLQNHPSGESPRTESARVVSLLIGEDWMPLGVAANSKLENLFAVAVGFGITASELNHDDYAGKDVAGKIAIARYGTPDGDNPHGRFSRYEDVRWKAIAARTAGAKALVIVSKQDSLKEDRFAQLRYDNSAGDAGLPVVVISRKAAIRLFSETMEPGLEDVERALERAAAKSDQEAAAAMLNRLHINLTTDLVRREAAAMNVIGILEGADPTLKAEAVVIGAHYDHLGRGGPGSLAARGGEVHHGADDNASGVAGMLELARIFSSQRPKPPRTIVFIAFGGEEEGLLGSNYYVNHPVIPLADTVAMFNMDMIGRLKANKLIIGGVGTAQEWRASIEEAQKWIAAPGPLVAGADRYAAIIDVFPKSFELTLTEDGFGPSDHSSFYAKKIPVLFFWTGTHEDYHKPSDTADKINYPDQARIVWLVAHIAGETIKGKRPTYTVAKSESTGRSRGFRVYLGTIPSYGESNDGLLLEGVRDDSPAAKAGLKGGDRIVKLAGREVHNVYDYTYALGEMKAGQEYEVEIVRGGERLKFKLTPAARN